VPVIPALVVVELDSRASSQMTWELVVELLEEVLVLFRVLSVVALE
jgi:hypothetical protein